MESHAAFNMHFCRSLQLLRASKEIFNNSSNLLAVSIGQTDSIKIVPVEDVFEIPSLNEVHADRIKIILIIKIL